MSYKLTVIYVQSPPTCVCRKIITQSLTTNLTFLNED